MEPALPTHAIALHGRASLRRAESGFAAAHGDGFELMRRAGQAAWRQLLACWPQAQRIVVACGPGNNGGDGYVLATQALQTGRQVRVVRLAPPATDLARRACAQFEAAGGEIDAAMEGLDRVDVIVDAVFGIGLARAPEGAVADWIDAINAASRPVLALDVPSGVDAETGNVAGVAIRATRTLQFLAAHPGLVTGAALDYCGALCTDTLGVELPAPDACASALRADALGGWLPPRRRDSHKGRNGHVLCIGGDHGSGGAIVLCAQAALRSGAGLVGVATRAAHVAALLAAQPEAMARAVDDAGGIDAAQFERATVLAIGPGLGTDAWGAALLDAAMACGKPLVLDADVLNLLARQPRGLPADTVLTPHPGEAARLLQASIADVQSDRYSAARALVERFGCVVVLKGAGTIVAAPGRTPCVIAAGNPGMAVGGMGDLLTGVVAALRAQGLSAFDAAACGALLHGAAGDDAAIAGERGLLPSDLLPQLRRRANPAGAN
ncbi:NAD(P)H-hydrate dehydratase [Cognatiluteimonas telluris]|uniref:NAD(P)H-hydrate dehydratase n=1 Tax=Cognatiluteimonas telluris TaxID=1104775 RepID=UPI0014077292|nr:NAD(P)H-hydrate dehydratase [Lysobacter telluris]